MKILEDWKIQSTGSEVRLVCRPVALRTLAHKAACRRQTIRNTCSHLSTPVRQPALECSWVSPSSHSKPLTAPERLCGTLIAFLGFDTCVMPVLVAHTLNYVVLGLPRTRITVRLSAILTLVVISELLVICSQSTIHMVAVRGAIRENVKLTSSCTFGASEGRRKRE